jgi:hypothetical protein
MIENLFPDIVRRGKSIGTKYYTVAFAIDADAEDYHYAPQFGAHDNLQMAMIWASMGSQAVKRFCSSFHGEPRVLVFVTLKSEDGPEHAMGVLATVWANALKKCLGMPSDRYAIWIQREGLYQLYVATSTLTVDELKEFSAFCDAVVWQPGSRTE